MSPVCTDPASEARRQLSRFLEQAKQVSLRGFRQAVATAGDGASEAADGEAVGGGAVGRPAEATGDDAAN